MNYSFFILILAFFSVMTNKAEKYTANHVVELPMQIMQKSLEIADPSGELQFIERGNNVQIQLNPAFKNLSDNFQNWFIKVKVFDDLSNPLMKGEYKMGRATIFKALSTPIYVELESDSKTKEVKKKVFEPGATLVPVQKINVKHAKTGKIIWSYYYFLEVDDEGRVIDSKGNIVRSIEDKHFYQLSTKIFESVIDIAPIKHLIQEVSVPNHFGTPALLKKCETLNPSDPKQSKINKPKKKKVVKKKTKIPDNISPYRLLKNERKKNIKDIKKYCSQKKSKTKCKKAKRTCEKRKEEIANIFLNKDTNWTKSDTLKKRTVQLFKNAKKVYQEISKDNQKSSNHKKRRNRNFKNTYNPHYQDPLISPELMTCIGFQETQGKVHPFAMNYHYCSKNNHLVSTAFGLGQVLRTTIRKFLRSRYRPDRPRVNLLPFNTKFSKKYKGLSSTQIHEKSSSDPNYQLELLYRVLNYSIKQKRFELSSTDKNVLLKKGVSLYDRDNESKYSANVLSRCLPCMQSIKKESEAWKCYQTLK